MIRKYKLALIPIFRTGPRRAVLLSVLVFSGVARADLCGTLLSKTNLTRRQIETLTVARAASREIRWRAFTKRVGETLKTVVLLGDRHDALAEDVAAAKPVLDTFERIGTTSGSTHHDPPTPYWLEPIAAWFTLPSYALTHLWSRRNVGSPMRCAKGAARCAHVDNMERLHRPRWTEELNLLLAGVFDLASVTAGAAALYTGGAYAWAPSSAVHLHQFMWAGGVFLGLRVMVIVANQMSRHWPIVKNRDRTIAEHLRDHVMVRGAKPYLGIVPRKHLSNLADELVGKHGFTEVDLTPP